MEKKLNKFLVLLLVFISALILFVLYNVYFGEVLYCSGPLVDLYDRPLSHTSYDFCGKVIFINQGEIGFVLDRSNDFTLYSPQSTTTDSTLSEYDITSSKAKVIKPDIANHPYYYNGKDRFNPVDYGLVKQRKAEAINLELNEDMVGYSSKEVVVYTPKNGIYNKIKSGIKFLDSKHKISERISDITEKNKVRKDDKITMRHLDRVRNQRPINHINYKGTRPINRPRRR